MSQMRMSAEISDASDLQVETADVMVYCKVRTNRLKCRAGRQV